MEKIKKIIFAPSVILFSVYFSVVFASGIVLGYISAKYFHRKITKDWGLNSVKINLGKWKLHFHHWLMETCALMICWVVGILDSVPKLVLGMTGGIVVQGIYDYQDWHKIIKS